MDLLGFREAYSTGCGPSQRESGAVWLGFASWVNSYTNEWEDHPNHWWTTHSSVFWQWVGTVLPPLGVSFSLQIGDQALVEFGLSSWTHLILIGLCFTLVLCHSFKSCALPPFPPVSFSFPAPHPDPQCCLYNLLEGQPGNSWPLGGKYSIIANPSRYSGLHLPCFLQYVQHQHLSVNPIGRVTRTQCLLEVHLLVASLQRQVGFRE